MVSSISHYLNNFKACLKIDHTIRDDVAEELSAHLEDKIQELEENGLSKEEASKIAVQSLGSPELIAQQIYETHAQGSWKEALFSALPHFLVALLFASYFYWHNVIWLSIILILTVGMAIYGWHRGKPIWLFPWLGYYLIPVVVTGILLLSLPQGWGWIAALIYIPLALFVFIYIVRQTARRDWLYASLMLAPMLVIFSWFSSLGTGNRLLSSEWIAGLQTNALWIVISLIALAGATIAFIRLKPRRYKILSLLIPPLVILFSVTMASRGNIDSWGWLILLFSLFAFAIPVWMQARAYQ